MWFTDWSFCFVCAWQGRYHWEILSRFLMCPSIQDNTRVGSSITILNTETNIPGCIKAQAPTMCCKHSGTGYSFHFLFHSVTCKRCILKQLNILLYLFLFFVFPQNNQFDAFALSAGGTERTTAGGSLWIQRLQRCSLWQQPLPLRDHMLTHTPDRKFICSHWSLLQVKMFSLNVFFLVLLLWNKTWMNGQDSSIVSNSFFSVSQLITQWLCCLFSVGLIDIITWNYYGWIFNFFINVLIEQNQVHFSYLTFWRWLFTIYNIMGRDDCAYVFLWCMSFLLAYIHVYLIWMFKFRNLSSYFVWSSSATDCLFKSCFVLFSGI